MTKIDHKDNYKKGVIYIILSSFAFALMGLFVNKAGDLHSIQKSLFRNLITLIIFFLILVKNKKPFKVEKKYHLPLALRIIFGTLGIVANFYALDHMLLADSSILSKLSPFFSIIFSYIILKEDTKVFQVISIFIALVGSIFVIKPDFVNLVSNIPSAVGLFGALCAGIAYVMVRILAIKDMDKSLIIFYFALFSSLILLPLTFFVYRPMSIEQLLYLIMAGLAATVGQIGVTYAYGYAKASQISVFTYSQIFFSAILGFMFLKQIPDFTSIIGYVIIIGIGIIMFYYERRDVNA